jgi:deazaflavin-dependent oxidoreductase (nitroreductase family)
MTDFNAEVVAEFRSNRGAVGGPLEGVHLALVTHRGARSGAVRTTPLRYYRDGDRLILFASNLGSARHPAWFRNVVANPRVTVEVGDETYEATAAVLRGTARDRIWKRLIAELPFLVDHQQRAGSREIPLIALRRLGSVA